MVTVEASSEALLCTLFARLDAENICYCVLRNFEGLPQRVDGDIDILVRPKDLHKVDMTIKGLSEDIVLARRREKNGHLQFHVIPPLEVKHAIQDGRPANVVVLDFQTQLQWMGMLYMGTEAVLSARQRFGNLYVAGPRHQAAHLVCHAILDKNSVRSEYKQIIETSLTQEGEAPLDPLITNVGAAVVTRLYSALRAHDDVEILKLRSRLIIGLVLSNRSSVVSYGIFLVRKIIHIVHAVLFPSGISIATAGPDGSGKSTLLRLSGTVLCESFTPIRGQYMGWKQFILPTKRLLRVAQKILTRRAATRVSEGDSDSADYSSSWTSNLSVLHYFLDLWARYLIQIRPVLVRGGLVLCDRYFYDVPVRDVWICKNRWLRSLLLALTPKPAVTILLSGDAEAIAARKGEISPSEVARQLAEFSSFKD